MNPKIPSPLTGIIPPIVTPLRERDVLDIEGLEKLIEHMISGGISGLFVLGTTGEGPALSYRVRREMVERSCKLVRGRIPVLVGISDASWVEALGMAQAAADAGADAVVSAGPFYFPVTQPELQRYVDLLVAEVALPIFLYNMPPLTKVTFAPDTVRRALQIDKIIGLKDSSGDMGYFHEILRIARERKNWTVLMGPDVLTPEAVLLGAHGGVNGGALLAPRLYSDLCAAALAKDFARLLPLQQKVDELVARIYSLGPYSSAIIKSLKCALSLMGICKSEFLCEPFERCTPEERKRIQQHLIALGLGITN